MITLIGSFAAVLTALCWVPQVRRTWDRGTADDFAWPYLGLLTTGVGAWCLYGILRSDPPIYLCNGFVLGAVLIITAVKLRGMRDRSAEEGFADLDEVG